MKLSFLTASSISLAALVSSCGSADHQSSWAKSVLDSYSNLDRTLADDLNGKLESVEITAATCGDNNLVKARNLGKSWVTCPWKLAAGDRFTRVTTIEQLNTTFTFSVADASNAGVAHVDVKFAIDHGDFLTRDYSVNATASSGVTFFKAINQYRNGPEHQVIYRASVPYAAGQNSVTSEIVIRNLEIKDASEATFAPVLRIRRNQAIPTDVLGGGPVRYESIMDSIRID